DLSAVAYGAGTFVSIGSGPGSGSDGNTQGLSVAVFTSSDGVGWVAHDDLNTRASYIGSVVYGRNVFLALGGDTQGIPTLFASPDGASWRPVRSFTDYSVNHIYFGGDLFFLTGSREALWVSADGWNWADVDVGEQVYLDTIGYGNGTYVGVAYH